jgi:hypothetical protein
MNVAGRGAVSLAYGPPKTSGLHCTVMRQHSTVHSGGCVMTWTIYRCPSRGEISGTIVVFHVTLSVSLLL